MSSETLYLEFDDVSVKCFLLWVYNLRPHATELLKSEGKVVSHSSGFEQQGPLYAGVSCYSVKDNQIALESHLGYNSRVVSKFEGIIVFT